MRVNASPYNPGTLPVVAVLQKAMPGLELSAAPPPTATHFLLYLSHDIFVGSAGALDGRSRSGQRIYGRGAEADAR